MIKIYYKAGRIIRQLHKHQTTSTKIKENERDPYSGKERRKPATYCRWFSIYT